VVKHAQANTVWVRLKREDAVLSLEVRDDGIGMTNEVGDPARLHGAGLRNLRERAEMTAGEFTIASSADGGTTAQIVWRLGADESVADTSQ
jgi:signal transduction histidine kinase